MTQDGWAADQTDYTQFSTPGNLPGFAVVRVHRLGWGGKDVPKGGSRVVIRVGELVRKDKQPALGRVTARCTFKINRLEDRTFLLQTPPPPFHVDVRIDPTFVPREIDPRDPDTRELGAQVGYSFSPAANVTRRSEAALPGCAVPAAEPAHSRSLKLRLATPSTSTRASTRPRSCPT